MMQGGVWAAFWVAGQPVILVKLSCQFLVIMALHRAKRGVPCQILSLIMCV